MSVYPKNLSYFDVQKEDHVIIDEFAMKVAGYSETVNQWKDDVSSLWIAL